ncbi:DNA-protecting protein DprA [Cohnella pontilimi]|uniref:DNA-protecting protein DprA n=1 Tax=Cohnella pontilimi TaxID=2564100 RepID=A0A4U0FEF5_9BACL|nr:DNA-processing protein DprA [Cohnella pontilimi]TJY43201.1 DNA-protecting protein DprA [Cohnella pontilimi]
MENNGISRETLVALHETEGLGWKTIQKLWEQRKERPIREGMREGDLRELGLLPKQAAALALSLNPERQERRRERRRRCGIEIVTFADPEYPELLRETPDPPWVIYFKGRLELASRPSIAVVGTRLATAYGRHVAEEYSAIFAERGFTVVSGMARGIDTCAHRGALHRHGGTVAVLGTPVDQIYPPENRQLYRDLTEHGLVLSETPPDTPFHPHIFPSRNRVIAGLSLAVLVVEAPENSGALITAKKAIDADREVFILPGPVTSPRSKGGLQLLQEGTGTVALDAEDVMKPILSFLSSDFGNASRLPQDAELTEEEHSLYEILLDEPRTIDELAADTELAFGDLHTVLLSLQIKRKIRQLPGAIFQAI